MKVTRLGRINDATQEKSPIASGIEKGMDHAPVRVALRKAKNLDMDDEEWLKVIEMLERKESVQTTMAGK